MRAAAQCRRDRDARCARARELQFGALGAPAQEQCEPERECAGDQREQECGAQLGAVVDGLRAHPTDVDQLIIRIGDLDGLLGVLQRFGRVVDRTTRGVACSRELAEAGLRRRVVEDALLHGGDRLRGGLRSRGIGRLLLPLELVQLGLGVLAQRGRVAVPLCGAPLGERDFSGVPLRLGRGECRLRLGHLLVGRAARWHARAHVRLDAARGRAHRGVASAMLDPLAAMSKRWELPAQRLIRELSEERRVDLARVELRHLRVLRVDAHRDGGLRVFVRGGPLQRHQRERDGEGDRQHEAAQQQCSDPRDDGEPE